MSLSPPSLKSKGGRIQLQLLSLDASFYKDRYDRFVFTSRIAPEDELSQFIIDKDEDRVWESTEPPGGSEERVSN